MLMGFYLWYTQIYEVTEADGAIRFPLPMRIDKKMDDGNAIQGSIRGSAAYDYVTEEDSDCADSSGNYYSQNDGAVSYAAGCVLYIRFGKI